MVRPTAIVFVALACCAVSAQNPRAGDSTAVALAAQSIAAMTGSVTVSDVTLTGNVTWSGSDTGTATLEALGPAESRMDLALPSGTRTEIGDAQTGVPVGEWINPDKTSGLFQFQNCQTDAVWFFPPLSSLAAKPNVILSYIGQETRDGEAVQHIQSSVYQPKSPPGLSLQQLSTMDFYLDATTLLPVAVTYNSHPDNDVFVNLPIETRFSDYQNMSGVLVPTHIQRYSQGNLMVDLTITGASFNSGLSLAIFTINSVQVQNDGRRR